MRSEPSQHLAAVIAALRRQNEKRPTEIACLDEVIQVQRAYSNRPQASIDESVVVKPTNIGGCKAEWLVPLGADERIRTLMIHGGGFYTNGLNSHRNVSIQLAKYSNCAVLAIDYRLSPETPFPGALDDCTAAWKYMLEVGPSGPGPADKAFVMGDSAGANLAAAMMLRLNDEDLRKADGCILLSAVLDLTCSGDSWVSNVAKDVFLGNPSGQVDEADDWWIEKYLDGEDPTNPYVSPLFGDLRGFPPVLIMVSKDERPFDDSLRFHERASRSNVDSTFECWEHVCHAWTSFSVKVPESDRALLRMGEFIGSRCRK